MLPSVDFCGLNVSRLIIGSNPFGGYSHQNPERDEQMLSYYTTDRIKETWARAEAAGINTIIANNETPHVLQAIREYLGEGGGLQWIAQLNCRAEPQMSEAIDEAVDIGCKAIFFHGGRVDALYARKDEQMLGQWCGSVKSHAIPVGVAGHAPAVHLWADSLNVADFHAVCFFNCGSLHDGKGETFTLSDIGPAADCVRSIHKPCIGYKILGAGRIDARMGFQFAFDRIKTTDAVCVGMHRGDKDDMVEENATIVRELLSR